MGPIVLVSGQRPWDKPESPACFSWQTLQGESGGDPTAITLETSKCQRGESRGPHFCHASQVQVERGVRGDDLRGGCHWEEDEEQTDAHGQVAAHRGLFWSRRWSHSCRTLSRKAVTVRRFEAIFQTVGNKTKPDVSVFHEMENMKKHISGDKSGGN